MYRDLQAGPKFPILRYENPFVTIGSTRHTKRGSVTMWTERVGRSELEWRDHKLAWADIQYKIVNSYTVGILMGAWMITSIRLLT